MRVKTFVSKVGVDGLRQMDETINAWLDTNKIEPRFVTQTCGNERHSQHPEIDPVLVTSVWYE